MRRFWVHTSVVLGLSLTVAVLGFLRGTSRAAGPLATTRYVAVSGDDASACNDPLAPCRTVQRAVDVAASGDMIKIASGVYTAVNARGGLAQVAYLSRTLTLRGGYTTTDWARAYPLTRPTTLDARGAGRVLYVRGPVSVTLVGLRVTGGDAGGLGGCRGSGTPDAGGGVYAVTATVALSESYVLSNTAYCGGGLHVASGRVRLMDSAFVSNTGSDGGALHLWRTAAWVEGSEIRANASAWSGGGLYLEESAAQVRGADVLSNVAQFGGGMSLWYADVRLAQNRILTNMASTGGGIRLSGSVVTLTENVISFNRASTQAVGGGLGGNELYTNTVTLIANRFVSNTAWGGGAVSLGAGSTTAVSNTFAGNRSTDSGGAVHLDGGDAVVMVGNHFAGNEARWQGGGAHLDAVTVTLQGNRFISNTTLKDAGGGLWVGADWITGTHNQFQRNRAETGGGGMMLLSDGPLVLRQNQFEGNRAEGGGGLYLGIYPGSWLTDHLLAGNVFHANTASDGGGLFIDRGAVRIEGNEIQGNAGGGLHLEESEVILEQNAILSNTAGGLSASAGGVITLTENVFAFNTTDGYGGGVWIEYSTVGLISNTFTTNSAWNTGGVCLSYCDAVTVLSNTFSANWAMDSNGGLKVWYPVTLTMAGNTFFDNRAEYFGGGASLWGVENTVLARNRFISNTISNAGGGGLNLSGGRVTVRDSVFISNVTANLDFDEGWGGGLLFIGRGVTVENTFFQGNRAAKQGGGLFVQELGGPSRLVSNTFLTNVAPVGGGLFIDRGEVQVEGNVLIHNRAITYGGGAASYPWPGSTYTAESMWINNVVAGNHAGVAGGGLYLGAGARAEGAHNTLAENDAGDGSGVSLAADSRAAFTNTILVSHTVGLSVAAGGQAVLTATLWGNGIDVAGAGAVVTGAHNFWGDAAFADPASGDYRLRSRSAAIDRGVPTAVGVDRDGDPRPVGRAPDLGADEFPEPRVYFFLPVVLR